MGLALRWHADWHCNFLDVAHIARPIGRNSAFSEAKTRRDNAHDLDG
jgi:hypothetical protein